MRLWPNNFAPNIKAVAFDLDNTLIDRDGAFEICLCQDFADPRIRQELRSLDRSGQGCRRTLFEAWTRATGKLMDQLNFAERLTAALEPNEELKGQLKQLRRDYKLAIISNGGSNTQWSKIRAAGLDEVFGPNQVWISGEVGLEKPDPRIFLLACEALKESPKNCLYIGDLDHVDGLGASSAGLSYQGCATL